MRAVFLDRDGVINEYPGDFKYVTDWENFHFLPNIRPALKKIMAAGYSLFIVSNQAGVSKGAYSQKNLDEITGNMLAELNRTGISITGVYYCVHLQEDNCLCRKPKTGLIEKAITDLRKKNIEIDLPSSYFIGDNIIDIQTGKSAGLKTILVFSGKTKPADSADWQILPDFTALSLKEAAELIRDSKR